MEGLLLLDKPEGLTSHDVVRRVRKALGLKRVGHAGTLDPLATGVLPVAVGTATRILEYLLLADKTYRATFRLGQSTDTHDAQGRQIGGGPWEAVTLLAAEAACAALSGPIDQVPPMFSALKQNGVALHQLARQGLEVERAARRVTVHHFRILRWAPPEMEVEVACSKGTYIRCLCHDLGQRLGCGAHITALRRTRVGGFGVDQCLPLERLTAESAVAGGHWLSMDDALAETAAVELLPEEARKLLHGVPPTLAANRFHDGVPETAVVRLRYRGELLAVARYGREGATVGDGLVVRGLKVLKTPEMA